MIRFIRNVIGVFFIGIAIALLSFPLITWEYIAEWRMRKKS